MTFPAPSDLAAALRELLLWHGADDVGFSAPEDAAAQFSGLPYAISLVVRLSDAVIDEIDTAPTHTYFHHYRTVNAQLDRLALLTGRFIQQHGGRYIAVGASQSINADGWQYRGRYSHKKAAVLAGLGSVGKSSLFLHRTWGPRVRLVTIFTDLPFPVYEGSPLACPCGSCTLCRTACPAGAITGALWEPGKPRSELFLPENCSLYMKKQFQHIGRGAVCGICMKVCPKGKGQKG